MEAKMSEPGARQQEKQKQRREERLRQRAEMQNRNTGELAKQQELTRQNVATQQELTRQTNARGWALMAASIHTAGPGKDAVFDTAEKFAAWILKK
jgi:hypothetical protein